MASNDIKAMRILREHSYPTDSRNWKLNEARKRYPKSRVIQDLKERPLIQRKSFGLGTVGSSSDHFAPIPPLKSYEQSDEIAVNDYADRLRAQREYAAKWAEQGRVRTHAEQEQFDAEMSSATKLALEYALTKSKQQ